MIISINNAALATQIFLGLFIFALAISFRKKTATEFLSTSLTQELKGLAILAIVFSHIGYFLVSDHNFLFPLTIAAGVGVDLFLFLSGYGLVVSALARPLSVWQFYRRRLPKLYLPFWLSILLFFGLDFFILHHSYGLTYIWQAIAGIFLRADVAMDLNSPLWYFTWIISYYLLFPLVFWRKYPWASAIALYLFGYGLVQWSPEVLGQVMRLYQLHILAFPLGVLAGGLFYASPGNILLNSWQKVWQKTLDYKRTKQVAYWLVIIPLVWLAGHTAYYSNYNAERWLAEATSLVTAGALLIIFMMNKYENRLLYWFGFFSYEVYLLHWPILSRYDLFYRYTPAWVATVLYLVFFLGVSWLMRWVVNKTRL